MNLYNKYRPTNLDQIKGNDSLVSTLGGLLGDFKKCPHVFLLHGPTGCGKTTIGRIILNELECVGNDLKEINASDHRGIDDAREIIDHSRYTPMEGRCRGWLIDECHRFTPEAQDALLKILEDTPPHVYFILCTTEPNKLKPTVRGRCSQFQVNLLNETQMYSLLRRVVKDEEETLEREVYDQIIQDALGHPRNALTILEQVLSTDPEQRLEAAKKIAVETSQSIELCRALLDGKKNGWKAVSKILAGLTDQDPEGIRRHVMGYCQSVLLKGDNPVAGLVLDFFNEPFYNSGFPGLVWACYSIVKH